MEQTEHDLMEQAVRLNTVDEFAAWEQCYNEFIDQLLDECSRIKRPRSAIDNHSSHVLCDLKV